jgi:SAM-dependent methyltransferase
VDDVPAEILEHYLREYDESSRITTGFDQLELLRAREVVRRHLARGRLRIVDVGGGTGAHASWLAGDGHEVHVVDLVERHISAVRGLDPVNGRITAEVGDARRLSCPDGAFDAALLLGPLYHLTVRSDRVQALMEASRVVRPGGPIFAAAISRFASLFDGLSREFLFDASFADVVDRDLDDGQHRNPERRPGWFTTAYFHHPDELRSEATDAGLDVVELLGVEGLAGWLPHLAHRWSDPGDREVILNAARRVEAEPSVLGASAHLFAGWPVVA